MPGYRHVVIFRLHDTCGPRERDEALALLRGLDQLPGIREWRVEASLDGRKGLMVVEVGLFDDAQAFQAFRESPAHARVSARMQEISDWWVADYLE
jgi:heme-degrading monooxygenase HmoA